MTNRRFNKLLILGMIATVFAGTAFTLNYWGTAHAAADSGIHHERMMQSVLVSTTICDGGYEYKVFVQRNNQQIIGIVPVMVTSTSGAAIPKTCNKP